VIQVNALLAAGYGEVTSGSFYVLLGVGGAALTFFAYLIGDSIYHRLKWRRLRRQEGQLSSQDPNR